MVSNELRYLLQKYIHLKHFFFEFLQHTISQNSRKSDAS